MNRRAFLAGLAALTTGAIIMRSDDLAPLFATTTARSPVEYSQGTIISFDPATFTNRVRWQGITLEDLPVVSGMEALTYRPGQTVALIGTGGSQWSIFGRIVTPGAGKGAAAVTYLSETIHTDTVATEETLNRNAGQDSGFVDLATTGPSVTFNTITGRWIAILFANGGIPGDGGAARMGYTAAGAQTVPAATERSSLLGAAAAITTAGFGNHIFANTHIGEPGEITVTARYRVIASASFPVAANWSNRSLLVISY